RSQSRGRRSTAKSSGTGLVHGRQGFIRDANAESQRAALAEEAQFHLFVDRCQTDQIDQMHIVLDTGAIEFEDHVAHLDASLLSRRTPRNARDTRSLRTRKA